MSNRSKRAKQFAALGGGALIAAPLMGTGVVHAASFEVTNLDDTGAGSLREAIYLANTTAGADTITFGASLSGTITLAAPLFVSESVDIVGPGAASVEISGNDANRVLYIYNYADDDVTISDLTISNGFSGTGGGIKVGGEGNLTLDGVTLRDNAASLYGGAINTGNSANLTLIDCELSGNTAGYGAGIYAAGGYDGDVTIRSSEFSNNTAQNSGGGLYFQSAATLLIEDSTFSGNTADQGGAVTIEIDEGGSATITGSTFSGNTALYAGGALYFGNVYDTVRIENSTFSGNTALYGGGIYVSGFYSGTDFTIAHSTITLNSSTGTDPTYKGGGGIYLSNDGWTGGSGPGSIFLDHTVVSGNTSVLAGDDLSYYQGGFTAEWSMIGALDGTAVSGTNMLAEGNAMLGGLADNGGPTLTHMPLAGSPLINGGDPAYSDNPEVDQRGLGRVGAGRIDVGAVESDAGGEPELPPTGSTSGLLVGLGAALLAVGGALHLTDRRRTRQL